MFNYMNNLHFFKEYRDNNFFIKLIVFWESYSYLTLGLWFNLKEYSL